MVVITADQNKMDLHRVRYEPQPAKFDHGWVCRRTARKALSNTLAETVGMTCRCAMAAQLPWLLLPLTRIRWICIAFVMSPSPPNLTMAGSAGEQPGKL